jgi:glycosyltransferase involved in cell wall biosynthesis
MIFVALLLLLLNGCLVGLLVYGRWRSRNLPENTDIPPGGWPVISIIIAARDEEAEIEQALQSVLRIDYPALEVIVVNDRSTDGTGAVLERLREQHPQLNVVAITELPAGWLGKNHALWRGVQQAKGEWLLFTDADIVFAPPTLKRAMALAHGTLDHLTISPGIRSISFWVNLLVALFGRNFAVFVQPWKVRDPKSPRYVGLGAFNLVRRSAYDKAGGHPPIRLRPDDDLKLGKILKNSGARQDIVFGDGALSLQWYSSVGVMACGLEKNVLAGVDYRISFLIFGLVFVLISDLGPWLAIPFADPLAASVALIAGLLSMLGTALFLPQVGKSWCWAVFTPVLSSIIVYMFARSAWLTIYRGGIAWRGCFYSLRELKENKV